VTKYLWTCNGKVSISLFRGLFCTCGMQKLAGIIGNLKRIIGSFWGNKRKNNRFLFSR